MNITPDQIIFFQFEFFKVNFTLVSTWAMMILLTLGSIYLTRGLTSDREIGRWQNFLEVIIKFTRTQLNELGVEDADLCMPFVASIFIYIATATILGIIPFFHPPTASLSTTAALATCVFFAVPYFGIAASGLPSYLKRYVEPTWLMLPFNILGDFTRTVALSVRLFGNAMSETMIIAICLSIAPLVFPLLMKLLGLLTGMVQAYIFAVLASLYIAAGIRTQARGDT